MAEETKTLLTECIRKRSDDFVLTRPDGSRVAQPRKDWYALCCRSGLGKKWSDKHADGKTSTHYEGLQMQDLRRSAVRRLIQRGIAEKVAMMISGHKTRSVFDGYNIINDRDLEQAAKLQEPSAQPAVSQVENRHKTVTPGFAHS